MSGTGRFLSKVAWLSFYCNCKLSDCLFIYWFVCLVILFVFSVWLGDECKVLYLASSKVARVRHRSDKVPKVYVETTSFLFFSIFSHHSIISDHVNLFQPSFLPSFLPPSSFPSFLPTRLSRPSPAPPSSAPNSPSATPPSHPSSSAQPHSPRRQAPTHRRRACTRRSSPPAPSRPCSCPRG